MSSPKAVETPQAILREVLPLKNQRRIDPTAFLSLTERLGISESEAKIYFLRELAAIMRQLPIKVFASPDDRLRLVDGIQQALDDAVEEEEERESER
jgi:type III secretion system TyeA family effector delivery regulator